MTDEADPDDEAPALPKLKPKERLFCAEYVIHYNATRAAKVAGYSEATAYSAGWRLLKNVEIRAEISRLTAERLAVSALNADAVDMALAELLTFNMADATFLTEQGEPYIDLSRLTREQMAAISEVTIEDFTDNRERDAEGKVISRDVRRVSIKTAKRTDVIQLAMRRLKLLVDRVELEVPDDLGELMREARARAKERR